MDNGLFGISWQLLLPVIVLELVLVLAALISCIKSEKTNGPKWMWILIILFVNLIGPVVFFVAGRRKE